MICHQLNLIIFVWELFNFSGIVSEKTCALNKLFGCPVGETCQELKNSTLFGVCVCKNSTGINSDSAQEIDTNNPSLTTPESVYSQGSSVSVIAGLLTAVLLVVLAASLTFAAKKYRWVHRVREKAQQLRERHYDTVLVNQEDDPPLA